MELDPKALDAAWLAANEGGATGILNIEAAIRAYLTASRSGETGWRDMADAPKDGSFVLLYSPDAVHPQVFIGQFCEFEGDPDPGEWYVGDLDQPVVLDAEPTHWQTLPAAPIPTQEPEPDDDGQPDEQQEWHDFDPDC